jgi:hypothetical protein
MNTTRKLPHSMTKDGRAGRGGEHLVPCLEMPRENVFIGVKTGKKHDKGYLAYIGVDVGTDDILKEIRRMDQTTEDDRKAMESFLQELQAFKIGNVVSITFSGPASCALRKEADHPVFVQPKGKVP